MIRIITFTVLLFSGIFSGLLAQDEVVIPQIITDRPDATESPNSVPKGYFQIETGGFYESFDEESVKMEVYGYNTTLIRYGLLENLELRLGWNFEEVQTELGGVEIDNVLSGFSPLLFGLKVEIAEENGLLPDIGILGHLMLPFSAGRDYKPESTGGDIRLSFAHTLSEQSGLGYNIGAQWSGDSSEIAYIYTLAYGHSILEWLGIYGEIYGDIPEDSSSNHFWDGGFTFLIKDNVQLDATVGSSLTKGQDILLSAGASFRFPN